MQKLNDIITNKEELRKIWDNNFKLREKVGEYYIEEQEFYFDEVLSYFKDSLSNWEFDIAYGDIYFEIKDNLSFLNGIIKATKYYGLLNDKDELKAQGLIKKLELIEELEEFEEYERVSRKIVKLCEELEQGILELVEVVKEFFDISKELSNYEEMFNYFYECYIDIMLYNSEENFIYDDSYILYKKVLVSYNK